MLLKAEKKSLKARGDETSRLISFLCMFHSFASKRVTFELYAYVVIRYEFVRVVNNEFGLDVSYSCGGRRMSIVLIGARVRIKFHLTYSKSLLLIRALHNFIHLI